MLHNTGTRVRSPVMRKNVCFWICYNTGRVAQHGHPCCSAVLIFLNFVFLCVIVDFIVVLLMCSVLYILNMLLIDFLGLWMLVSNNVVCYDANTM